ncbi:MAG: CPBP family intramembrane metalloprotease [Ardenticatenaceae bacterium]|nr:CPBP family intramembrane metalloprotease [Ardenticatenaceae bacterium]
MISTAHSLDKRKSDLRAVWIFCLVTAVLSTAILAFLPGYAGPAIVVFIPAVTAVILISHTAGKSQVRPRLFSRRAWHFTFKWLLISLGLTLVLRLGVSLLGLVLVPGYQYQPGPISPLLLMVFLFAAAEEIGWRGFALPTLLKYGFHPLVAALLLGVPWALLHLPLVSPGMLSAGTPPLAQFLVMMSLSVLLTWAYLAGGSSLSTAVLLHGGQNFFAVLNYGLNPVASGWLMAAVYGVAALLVVLLTRGRLGWADNRQETALKQ